MTESAARRCALAGMVLAVLGSALSAEWHFEHRLLQDYFADPEPTNGECAIVDINGDGHPDLWWSVYAYATSSGDRPRYNRQKDLYQMAWYKGPAFQQMFRMHKGFTHGGRWLDLDSDGDLDCITGRACGTRELIWLENPGDPERTRDWPCHEIHKGDVDPDMILPGDLDGDGRVEIVIQSFRQDVHCFEIPRDPKHDLWPIRHLGHSGQPRTGASIGDVDQDGDLDVMWGHGWLENPGRPDQTPWTDHIIDEQFHRDAQSVVADLDRDGRPDVILAGEESFDGLAWYSRGDAPRQWVKHPIACDQSYSGLHSLAVADFDRDGDLDIFTAEMHASGYIKQEPPHKVTVFENVDLRHNVWREHILAKTGSHNARVGDINGDGYPDIIGSNWNNRLKDYPVKAEVWLNRIGAGMRVYPENPHWLQFQGQPILLVGDSITQGWMELGTNFAQKAYVDALARRGINVVLLWSYIGVVDQASDTRIGYDAPEIWPWVRANGKFDLTRFNEAYFDRLRELIRLADANDIVVVLQVHDGWTKTKFAGHPFNVVNGGSLTDRAQFVELHDYEHEMPPVFDPQWTRPQKHQFYLERFCETLIQATADAPNVMFEIFNEGEWYEAQRLRAFQRHFLDFFKTRTSLPLIINDDHLRGVTSFRGEAKADVISHHTPRWDDRPAARVFFDHYCREFDAAPTKPMFFSEPVPSYEGGDAMTEDALLRLLWGTALGGASVVVQNDASFGFDPRSLMVARAE